VVFEDNETLLGLRQQMGTVRRLPLRAITRGRRASGTSVALRIACSDREIHRASCSGKLCPVRFGKNFSSARVAAAVSIVIVASRSNRRDVHADRAGTAGRPPDNNRQCRRRAAIRRNPMPAESILKRWHFWDLLGRERLNGPVLARGKHLGAKLAKELDEGGPLM
jgi:hypothetical protein